MPKNAAFKMIKLINDLWFKRRDLVSDGYDESLEYISRIIPIKIHRYPSGMKCWTWAVPEKWSINEAYIEDLKGNRILDTRDHPLHVVSYSLPVDAVVSKEELMKHIYTRPERAEAIPFEYKYYERDWGFCIQHNRLKEFTSDRYKVFIDAKFEKGDLKVGDCTIKGKTEQIIVLAAHLCHPAMANDDLTGVSVLAELAREMGKRKNNYTYKFLILPETIGSISYLSRNESLIKKMECGIFLEMLGNDNNQALQMSKQGNTILDRIAKYVMKRKTISFREGLFRKIVGNDEMVFNGPGVDIPMISLSRFPYPEYHTSDDNPSIVSEERLNESKDLVLEILNILDNDYIPKRKFKGPVFLSGYGLWIDPKANKNLNAAIEQIMLRLEDDKSIFEIAQDLGLEFEDVLKYVNKFYDKGLITKEKSILRAR